MSVVASNVGHTAHFSSTRPVNDMSTFPVFVITKVYSSVSPAFIGVEFVDFSRVQSGIGTKYPKSWSRSSEISVPSKVSVVFDS